MKLNWDEDESMETNDEIESMVLPDFRENDEIKKERMSSSNGTIQRS